MKQHAAGLLLLLIAVVCYAEYPDPIRVQKNLELLVTGEKKIDQFNSSERVEMRVQIQKMKPPKSKLVDLGPIAPTPSQPATPSKSSQYVGAKAIPSDKHRARTRTNGYGYTGIYEVQVSHNDELFIINDEKFSARTYCFNMEKGDQVKFVDGSPFGACVSAVLLNLRTSDTCEVWCE